MLLVSTRVSGCWSAWQKCDSFSATKAPQAINEQSLTFKWGNVGKVSPKDTTAETGWARSEWPTLPSLDNLLYHPNNCLQTSLHFNCLRFDDSNNLASVAIVFKPIITLVALLPMSVVLCCLHFFLCFHSFMTTHRRPLKSKRLKTFSECHKSYWFFFSIILNIVILWWKTDTAIAVVQYKNSAAVMHSQPQTNQVSDSLSCWQLV